MANSFTYNQTKIAVGDRIAVHLRIEEEGKTRTQIFEGLVIGVKGRDIGQTFTIRKIASNSIGVERILPVASPFIDKIEMITQGNVRRSKLYYLRERVGRKALRVKGKKRINIKAKDEKKPVKSAPKKAVKPTPKKETKADNKSAGTKSGATSKKAASK